MKQTLVRGQNPYDFTVRVQHLKTGQTMGTGFVVSADGKIVTCTHVVVEAGVDPLNRKRIATFWKRWIARLGFGRAADIPVSDHVGIYFPQLRQNKSRTATVIAAISDKEDDVVLLQLVEGPSPLGPEKVARLGAARDSRGHPFETFGYRRLGEYEGMPGRGKIVGHIDKPEDRQLQYERVMLESQHIESGMSGAAVLDPELNLVVGVIAETSDRVKKPSDRDTSIAVDVLIFRSSPFDLPIHDGPFELGPSPLPPPEPLPPSPERPREAVRWNNAPHLVDEWVGRAEMLALLTADFARENCYLTSAVGFGGEGKSSLLRRWVDNLLSDSSRPRPHGVFWWTFNTIESADQFFEAAVEFVGRPTRDSSELLPSSACAHIIAARLYEHRFVFVLDGLEVLQEQQGDHFGKLTNSALRDLLIYFANGGHKSFCLLASRVPLLELMAYSTHKHHDVGRLSAAEGRELLQKLGVRGPDAALEKIVGDWDGHALTLSLLGSYLASHHDGDVASISQIPPPTADEPHYERVYRVLRCYDQNLTPAERLFLTMFSAFRKPAGEIALEEVFRRNTGSNRLDSLLPTLDDTAFKAMLERLVKYHILRHDPSMRVYTTHPLIRNHYLSRLLEGTDVPSQAVHQSIKDYYVTLAKTMPSMRMEALIEAVHHACRARAYDEAIGIYQGEIIGLPDWGNPIKDLGNYQTNLALMLDFFPSGDVSPYQSLAVPSQRPLPDWPHAVPDPAVTDRRHKRYILNEVGDSLMAVGRPREAIPFFCRKNEIAQEMENCRNLARGYVSLAAAHAYLGELAQSVENACKAVKMANRLEDWAAWQDRCDALCHRAWSASLLGDLTAAGDDFRAAEALERNFAPSNRYLYTRRGIWHADHLRRAKAGDYARKVAEACLTWVNALKVSGIEEGPDKSQCERLLADLDADSGQHKDARAHYNEALRIARNISDRSVLIEALLARGRWAARLHEIVAARSDLEEVLEYATAGGYRIYEADIRLGLAWAEIADQNPVAARTQAEYVQHISTDMGYYWGKVDAAELLAELNL
jgi:tetratricopeptide (TPR) repeat protein